MTSVAARPVRLRARLDTPLSRWLWLVKWLATPAGSWSFGGGLIELLALIAGVALLFTGRYPGGVFDLLLGLHR